MTIEVGSVEVAYRLLYLRRKAIGDIKNLEKQLSRLSRERSSKIDLERDMVLTEKKQLEKGEEHREQ